MAASSTTTVTPRQPWANDGTADVTPNPPTVPSIRNLPLEHRLTAGLTVTRSAYPHGLVILWIEGPTPPSSTATLPLERSGGQQVILGDDKEQQWPDGFVIWFDDL
jgi:hypothetical protein